MHRDSNTQSLLITQRGIVVLLSLSLGFFLWAWVPALSVGFLTDDYEWFIHITDLDPWESWRLFWPRTIQPVWARYRPLIGLSFLVDWRVWGLDPHGYHLWNLLWHAFSVVGVFFLASSLWKVNRQRDGIGAGLLAAFWFAVNPLLSEAVTWISGRHDVIVSAFLLWSLVFLFWSISRSRARLLLAGSWFFALVSLLAKEVGLTYPLLVAVILIYKDIDNLINNKKDRLKSFWQKSRQPLIGSLLVVAFYTLVSTGSLGRPFWQVSGYTAAVSRPFFLWLMLTVVGLVAYKLRGRVVFTKGWLVWLLIGIALLPIALLPTQLRFLYLPAAMAAIWLSTVIPDLLKRVGLQRALLPIWIAVVAGSAIVLRLENLEWLRVSRLQQQTVAAIRLQIAEVKPELVFLFNLPDHAGRVPLFRTYVAEAVLIGYQGVAQMTQEVQVIAGPKTVDLDESSLRVIDSRRLAVESNSGFVVFEPAIRQRFPDGSVQIAGEQWFATVSADRRQAEITLASGLHEEGVLGLTFHLRGGILKAPRE